MTITLTLNDELVESTVKSIMENFPEASRGNTLCCTNWNYDGWNFSFYDEETGTEHKLAKPSLIQAFSLIFTDKWPRGLTQPPVSDSNEAWDDWLSQCDAGDFDGFVQLAIFGEIIYG